MSTVSAFAKAASITPDYAPFAVIWTREDCEKLEATGVLNYHYELIEGVILKKMGQNRQHSLPVMRAIAWLIHNFDPDSIQTQSSIYVAEADNRINKPEPDIALLNRPLQSLETDQPRPEDIQLIIEVSDTTLDYDRGSKADLYARAGIPEYWIVSVEERALYIHTAPVNGIYIRTIFDEAATVSPKHAPNATVRVSDLLSPTVSS